MWFEESLFLKKRLQASTVLNLFHLLTDSLAINVKSLQLPFRTHHDQFDSPEAVSVFQGKIS